MGNVSSVSVISNNLLGQVKTFMHWTSHKSPWRLEEIQTINHCDSHLCPSQGVLGQLYLEDVFLANDIQKFIIVSMRLIISKDGCKALQHDDLLTILTILTGNYSNKLNCAS